MHFDSGTAKAISQEERRLLNTTFDGIDEILDFLNDEEVVHITDLDGLTWFGTVETAVLFCIHIFTIEWILLQRYEIYENTILLLDKQWKILIKYGF